MSKAIHFSRVEIRKMPGFPRGGLAVEELANGINVVYGPNASGKTTLARAMQQLLRLNAKGRQTNSLTAQLSLADKSYILDYHLGSTNCYSEGHEISLPPALAEARMGPWYVLALHDLVQQEDDQDIVRQVLREAAGGYDVPAAASELGFQRERPRSTNIKEVRAYQEAQKSRKNAEQHLREIDREEQGLGDLEQKRKTAQRAVSELKKIEHALEAHAANKQLEQKQRVVNAFPATMSKIVGNEREQLETLKTDLKKQQKKLASKNIVLETSQDAIQKTGLPESGVARAVVETLQVRVDLLTSKSREIQRLEGERTAAQIKLSESLERLGPDVSPGQVETLDAALLNRLFKFVRKVETHWQNQQAVERMSHWLAEIPESNEDPETLREGIQLLQQWLAEQRIQSMATTSKWGWLIAAGLITLVGLGMTLVHWSWLLLIAVAAGLALRAFLLPRSPVSPTGIQAIAEKWPGLDLASPDSWTFSEVQSTLRLLQKNLGVAQVHQEKNQRFADLRERSEKLKKQQQEIEQERREWREKLGLELSLDDDALVYLLAEDIRKAQSAQAEMAAACEKLAITQQQQKKMLTACRTDLIPYSPWPETTGAAEVAGLVRDLQSRGQDHSQAREQLRHARDEIEQCRKTIAECQSERTELFKQLNLQEDDEATLQRWLEQFPQYQQATEKLRRAEYDCQRTASQLKGQEVLRQQSPESLEEMRDECERLAEELPELDKKTGEIGGLVERAKKETNLEKALAAEATCLNTLHAIRKQDADELVGTVLTSYLTRQQQERQQPGILTRARELFARITHGRYRLLVEPGEPPTFQALDTSLEQKQNLDELSSGTRLQLLLSVRVAFVEQQERGLQLPLIFDETLGNSDEQRAGKIIEAAVELARGGRQVFYLTAQHDELAKWRRALGEQTDITWKELDLARLRGFSEVEYAPERLHLETPQRISIPAPGEDDWETYGVRLNVPPLEPRGPVGGFHLWYLIDNVQELYRLLRQDINKWGQLQTLADSGYSVGLNHESSVYVRANATANFLTHLLRFWRQGRGKPVDRTQLEDSGKVSSAFIDEVSQLSQSLNGDARQLISELRNGRVRRFRTTQIEALETYLSECGCLDDQPVLEAHSIQEATMPLVFADCDAGLLSHKQIDHLMNIVTCQQIQKANTSDEN